MSDELRRVLWPKGHRADIWAIVDAAQDQQVYWTLTNSFLPHSCLFAGALPEALEMAAPYLVQLDPEDKFTDYLGKNLWRNVALFLQCDASLHELRHHLRTFLTVKDTSGRRMLFRYYDPRVMRVYLPTCTTMELQTVFGPVSSYWAVSEERDTLTQFSFRGKDLQVTPRPLGTPSVELATVIVAAQSVMVMPKGGTAQTRVPVLLQGAGQGGTLHRWPAGIRFFRTLSAPEELPMVNGAYAISATALEPDVTVYAQAVSPGDVKLTLETTSGGKAEATLQVVELALDGGGAEICVGTTKETRRRLDVRPTVFEGRLLLRSTRGLTLFADTASETGFDLVDGFEFDAPLQTVSFWLQGTVAGRGEVQLLIAGSQAAGDTCAVTVVELAPEREQPLTLLSGSGVKIPLAARKAPDGVRVQWSVEHAGESQGALPTIEGSDLLTNASGKFVVRGTAGDTPSGWGGPFTQFEVNLVQAAVAENRSTFNGRFCVCTREAGSDFFRVHCGNGGVTLDADIRLSGPAPDGKIRSGWIHKVVSDNSGAKYKGGVTRQANETFAPTFAPPGEMTVQAQVAPSAQWMVQDGGPIEQIWRYLQGKSYLAVWSTDAPDAVRALLEVGWSFTADYACNPTKTTRTVVPARLAPTGTVAFPTLREIEE